MKITSFGWFLKAHVLWFRVKGYGLHICETHRFTPLLREQLRDAKALYIGPLKIRVSTPYNN